MSSRATRRGTPAKIQMPRVLDRTSGQRQDFTYRKIAGEIYSGSDFGHSLFIGTIIQDCRFNSVTFSRCDFSGSKIANCSFEDCIFSPDEFRACIIVNCTFTRCSFKGAQWLQVEIRGSYFESCDFREASLRENHIVQSRLDTCRFKKSSMTLNEFDECNFSNINFGDCTALFLGFSKCDFDRCRMNAETIGFTYGLSIENLEALALIYLGQPQPKLARAELIDALLTAYNERHWSVGLCALKLNFAIAAPLSAIRSLAHSTIAHVEKSLPIDWDEYRFIVNVFEKIHGEGRLPLAGTWMLRSALIAAPANSRPSLVGSDIYVTDRLERLMLDQIDSIGQVSDVDGTLPDLTLELKLDQRPARALDVLVPPKMMQALGGTNMHLVEERAGSWVELWQASSSTLVALQASLFILNGVAGQLLKCFKTTKQLVRELTPRSKSVKNRSKPRRKLVATANPARLAPISLDVRISISYSTASSISSENLFKIESAIKSASTIPESEISDLRAYDASHLVAASVAPTPTKRKKREHRKAV